MLEAYRKHVEERAAEGIPPLPLNVAQTRALTELLENPPPGQEESLLDMLTNRVPAGVDDAAKVKAEFLATLVSGEKTSPVITKPEAVELLGTMLGGFNVAPLVELLGDSDLGEVAAQQLSNTLLVADAWDEVMELSKTGEGDAKKNAKTVVDAWAAAEWFTSRPPLDEKITVTVFKVPGETNTDDLSPAPDAWSRPDIPLHALAFLKIPREGVPNALDQVAELKEKGHPIAYVGDVVGTGSSRKSAVNSVLWHFGNDIPCIPNKRAGSVCIGAKIAPIFFNTMEDSGALPFECDVSKMEMGDVIDIYPYQGVVKKSDSDEVLAEFELKTQALFDEVQAGGRIPLMVGRALTVKTRAALGLDKSDVFKEPPTAAESDKGYTLAQKVVGRACGVEGVRPGSYCEPHISTVGSQDTTGPMTRDEIKELACLKFSADLVMQSFCHTAAYPKPVDVKTHQTLPDFFTERGGIALRPGDGIIHSWLNRMLLPDQVGTGGDSHTRFPLGISFPAGSGLVAFAAAQGVMPLDMPESVLIRFKGEMQPGITLRDLVNAIPWIAIQSGDLTVAKKGKKNIYSGRILEIEGLPDLSVEQAFELSDASAERSAGGCTIRLGVESITEYLNSNIVMLRWLIHEGYHDAATLEKRAEEMEAWIANPVLLEPDQDAEYVKVFEVDLAEITEPLLACPNDPDDVKKLSEVAGDEVQEVFIGSCMTNIGHFRAAAKLLEKHGDAIPTRLWIVPPTKMDETQLVSEGVYSVFGRVGARTEVPGCSLCMGNQARALAGATVVSTSTRNFPNRLGTGANVYLASAELAAVVSILGRLPSVEEYMKYAADLDTMSGEIYRYLNFDKMDMYVEAAENAIEMTKGCD